MIVASTLTGTSGLVAIGAAALAVAAIGCCLVLARSLRRLRKDQRLVLGDGSERDLIAQGATLQEAFSVLEEYVGEGARRIEERLSGLEHALQGTIKHHALVRYDAYNELSGQQSMSIALLDNRRSGVVLSCIHHRDQARVYAKQIHDGHAELELSPEEAQAFELALNGQAPSGGQAPAAGRHTHGQAA
jgi:uncharacterized protein DUF4446